MTEHLIGVRSIIHSVPETMIQSHGNYDKIASFKLVHNGETFQLPHYNFDASIYCDLYKNYIQMLTSTCLEMKMFHVSDTDKKINLANLEHVQGNINEFIFEQFDSRDHVFYISIENTKQYDIERSLITNSTFQEECNICYQTNSLKHYYNCDLRDKTNHHGICGSCYIAWHHANPENTCPTCRAPKKAKS